MPGLLLLLWNKPSLKAISDKKGKIFKLDPTWESSPNRRWARLLVEVDLHDEILEEIELVMGDRIWSQKDDYWKLPFQCFSCHK
jgi:hypothetical protein